MKILKSLFVLLFFISLASPVFASSNNNKFVVGYETYFSEIDINKIMLEIESGRDIKSSNIKIKKETKIVAEGEITSLEVTFKKSKEKYSDGSEQTQFVALASSSYFYATGTGGNSAVRTNLKIYYTELYFENAFCYNLSSIERQSYLYDSQFSIVSVTGDYGQSGYHYTSTGQRVTNTQIGYFSRFAPIYSGSKYITTTNFVNYAIKGQSIIGSHSVTKIKRIANGAIYEFTVGYDV